MERRLRGKIVTTVNSAVAAMNHAVATVMNHLTVLGSGFTAKTDCERGCHSDNGQHFLCV